MAGAGFKTFNTGDVLTASDVNTYLMQQTTMVFDDASARSTALGANVAEGMLSYLKDTNAVERYDGSSWGAIGAGDIEGVTAGAGLSGGGTSGTVTLNLATTAAGRNAVINGGFDIWQRGTSLAVSSGLATTGYTADRWTGYFPTATTVSRQATGDTTNLPNIQYCARVQRDNASSNTTVRQFTQSLETVNSIPFAGKTIVLSFYARAGANFSSASSILNAKFVYGTGTDQNYTGTYTGATSVIDQNATLTTTWQRFTYSGTVAATATEVALQFQYTPVGTAGAADYFEITGVQLELGSVATPFSRAGGTIQGELAACQRYYYRASASSPASKVLGVGYFYNASQMNGICHFPVTMRTAPTLISTTGTNYYAWYGNGSATNFSSLTIFDPAENQAGVYTGISGTTGQAGAIYTLNASSSVAFNAEL